MPSLAWLRSAGGRRERTAGLAWGGSAGSVLEEPALRQECGECGSRRRPAAGINGSSPAPRAAPSSLGKGESCRPTPASFSSPAPMGSRARMVSPGTYSVPGVWPHCPGCSPGFPGSCWPAACSPIPAALVQNNQTQLRFKYKILAGGSGKSLVSHGNSWGTQSTRRDGDAEGPSPFRSRLKSWSRRISQSLLFLMAFSKASRLEDALTRFS